jgi:hypothetical protein
MDELPTRCPVKTDSLSAFTLALDLRMALILGMISIGCVVATLGELRYSFIGFLCQAAAVIVRWLLRFGPAPNPV